MRYRAAFLIALFLSIGSGPAWADKRVALVIGNSDYRALPKLISPESDATEISLLFRKAGFDTVELKQNLTNADMRRAIHDFSENTKDADITVLFFAGRGIEVGGQNYLIPVDSALKRDVDAEDEAVSLDRVLTLLEPAKSLRLIILAASRDNPFTASVARTPASRAVSTGLAKIETQSSNTLIAYATKAGSTASDGKGANSPFTLALSKHLMTPGLEITLAFRRIRDEVLVATNMKQEPFIYGRLSRASFTLAPLIPAERTSPQLQSR